jgi:hypothetical protein
VYHYLKWAALSLFFKRNLRYLVLIAVGFVGIYVADAVYEDMADFAAKAGATEKIGTYLLLKWLVVVAFAALILFSVMRLGFGGTKARGKKRKCERNGPKEIPENDPVMKRLEKFRKPEKLRHRSEIILERKRGGK